jgi:hypothetical protein
MLAAGNDLAMVYVHRNTLHKAIQHPPKTQSKQANRSLGKNNNCTLWCPEEREIAAIKVSNSILA